MPEDSYILYWVLGNLKPADALALLKPRLADRPLRVEWHRAYQSTMEKEHPEQDLRPEYRHLVQETHEQPDAIYLLARLLDFDETDQLYRKAAAATPPSVHALHALGWRPSRKVNSARLWTN